MKPYRIRNCIREIRSQSYAKDPAYKKNRDEAWLDCASGINPFGVPEKVVALMKSIDELDVHHYPASYDYLRKSLIRHWSEYGPIDETCLFFTGGAMEGLVNVNRLFTDPANRVIGGTPQFPDYANDVALSGGTYLGVPMKGAGEFVFDADRILDCLHEQDALIYIDNPNNPTGQIISLDEIRYVAKTAERNGTCVLVDEAYGEFMDQDCSAISLLGELNNLMVVRSFSKGFGMAGLRAGYVVMSAKLAPYYEKIDIPYRINSLAAALIPAALEDRWFLHHSRKETRRIKEMIMNACQRITVISSHPDTPILLMAHPNPRVNFQSLWAEGGIGVVAGHAFHSVPSNYIRLRIPSHPEPVLRIIAQIEQNESDKAVR